MVNLIILVFVSLATHLVLSAVALQLMTVSLVILAFSFLVPLLLPVLQIALQLPFWTRVSAHPATQNVSPVQAPPILIVLHATAVCK